MSIRINLLPVGNGDCMDSGCCKSRAITEGVDDNMHHNLDVKPIPEKVLYINELSLADSTVANRYETKKQYEKAVSGETVSKT
ncbi:MAG: hypothetical protein MR936_12905 [Eubacterium sp.]|nr:hypothetical protein [Eubacterium sp.]